MLNFGEEDNNEHFITCPVCLSQFDDQEKKPKISSCSHTTCLQCVKEIYTRKLTCPVCRHPKPFDQGVDQLPTNQHVLHIIKLHLGWRCQKLIVLSETLEVESLVKELLDNYSPDEAEFFKGLAKIIQFTVKQSMRSLEPVWKLQDHWKDNPLAVFKLHQTIADYVGEMDQLHLDYLLNDLKPRWGMSDNAERFTLLEFAHRLVIKANNEQVTTKVMDMVWGFVNFADIPNELMNFCIEKLEKMLSDGWTCELFSHWLFTCAQAIQAQQKLTVPAMKLLRHLAYLFAIKQAALNNHYRHYSSEFKQLVFLKYKEIYTFIDREWQLFGHSIAGLVTYMMESPLAGDTHIAAVQERLAFLWVFLKYGQMYMDEIAVDSIWTCLVNTSNSDPGICFQWFARVIEMPMMESKAIQLIYHQHILKLDPRQAVNQTTDLMDCFERFFRAVQCSDGDTFTIDITDPRPGLEFLWKIVHYAAPVIAQRAFELLKETIIYLGPQLLSRRFDVSNDVIGRFLEGLKDTCFANRMQSNTRMLLDEEELNLMDCLTKLLDSENISRTSLGNRGNGEEFNSGLVSFTPVPQTFDANNSIFIVTITKRGRLLRPIRIKPSPRFRSIKFVQDLGSFCYNNPTKIGRRVAKSTKDTFVSLKMKNAMFQPVVPEMLNYHIWLDSENYAQKAYQVGITGIQSCDGRGGNRVKGWQLVFLLRDMEPGAHLKKSLLFGNVIEGIDVVKSLSCSSPLASNFSDGIRFTLQSV